jgi:CRISPR-associated protein Cas2
MYILLVYDVEEKRVNRVMKICRQYLSHIQNSVFEGQIKDSDLMELKSKLGKIIKNSADSVIIFKFLSEKYFKKETLGINKLSTDNIL